MMPLSTIKPSLSPPWLLLLAACGVLPAADSFQGMQPHFPFPTPAPTSAAPSTDCGPGGVLCTSDDLPLPTFFPTSSVTNPPTHPPTSSPTSNQPGTSDPTTSRRAGIFRSGSDLAMASAAGGNISLAADAINFNGRDLVALIDELQAANAVLRADNAELRTGQTDLLARVEALEAKHTAAPSAPVPTGSPTWVLVRDQVDIRDNNIPGLLTTNTTRDGDLQRITSVRGDVRLERCNGLASLDGGFQALRFIGSVLRIDSNAALASLGDGFSALEEVGGDPSPNRNQAIWIYNNAALTSLGDGFSALQRIGESLRIYNNDALTSLEGGFPALIEIGGWLHVDLNDQLASLGTAFPSLQRVVGKLSFDNRRLTNFEALRNLTCIGGVDRCVNCPSWLTDKPRC